nr:hypothetical protein [Clostridium botulinum]
MKNQYKQLKDNLTKTQLNLGNINNLADNLNNFKFMIDKTENIEQKKMLINSVIEDVIVTDEK